MQGLTLTDEQKELIRRMKHWFRMESYHKPYFSYSGKAGTGKTFVIHCLIDELGLDSMEYICGAYVGKAVLNLIHSGLPARTIHSIIYETRIVSEIIEDEHGNKKVRSKMQMRLRSHLERDYKLLIFDEATMINDEMKEDILSFGIPCIFIGDMNQLPPVFGTSSVMLHPDFILHQIMRQAEDNPIIMLADRVLAGAPLIEGVYGQSRILRSIEMGRNLLEYDQMICGKNKTRDKVNRYVRKSILHRPSPLPMLNDKIVCKQNNWGECLDGLYLTNGLIGYVVDINRGARSKKYMVISFQPEFLTDGWFDNIRLDIDYFKLSADERKEYGYSRYNKFEFAYIVSVHTYQGSQASHILYFDERMHDPLTTQRLRYTAITRASEAIDIVISKPRELWEDENL